MIDLSITKRTDSRLLERMAQHYSKPKGFVGRSICYAISVDSIYYGHIIAGSATRFLQGRNEFFDMTIQDLNHVINNIFFSISKVDGRYPGRNFTSAVVREFTLRASKDWFNKYGDKVIGFETLVEKPREGRLYLLADWTKVGETKGFTCKRIGGKGTDSYSGKRVWDTKNLRPKNILCYKM